MSTAPSPASTPSPPSNSTASPPPAAPAPATPSPVPPVTPSAPPPATPSAPPPATPSAPPPATPSAPPPATPSAPPPATPSTPPPATPSVPPPATPSTPPPAMPSPPPPPEATAPPPATTASPPPATTPATPSPPPPTTTPAVKSPPPPRTTAPSTPAAKSPPLPARSSPTTPSGTMPSPSSASSFGGGVSTGLVVGVAVGAGVVLVVLTLLFLFCRKKRKRYDDGDQYYYAQGPPRPPSMPYGQKDNNGGPPGQWQYNAPPAEEHIVKVVPKPTPPPFMSSSGGSGSNYSGSEQPFTPPSLGIALGFAKSTFTHEELMLATNGFSDANLLGQGGFGYVHKGVLPNGKEVAVKKLKAGSGQGEREFQAEVEIISRVHHKHLVSLVGYCITGSQRMLVYEFVPNNTLEFHLHGKGRPMMDWPTRLRIALGSAKGLAYLHEDCHPKIIHRDIKAANILLDFKFEAKVADFGLAKFTSDTNTHVSTRVMGTFGYLAPEYASSGKLTEKSDVFSFGVMLLELITGRRPVDTTNTYTDDSLVDWARPELTRALEDGSFDYLADPKLQSYYNHREMARMVACAAACVRHSARRRPRMSQIVRALEGDASLSDLNEGIRPGQSGPYSSCGSSDYDNSQHNEDLKRFRKMVMASQEYGSSECSEPTSEYGVYPSGSSTDQTTREMEMAPGMKGSSSQGFSGGGRRY